MLEVALNEGRYEIIQLITKSCSAFGNVKSIRLFLDSSATAVVEMSTMEQTAELALKLGGKLVGATAFIGLAHRPHARDKTGTLPPSATLQPVIRTAAGA